MHPPASKLKFGSDVSGENWDNTLDDEEMEQSSSSSSSPDSDSGSEERENNSPIRVKNNKLSAIDFKKQFCDFLVKTRGEVNNGKPTRNSGKHRKLANADKEKEEKKEKPQLVQKQTPIPNSNPSSLAKSKSSIVNNSNPMPRKPLNGGKKLPGR